jgi:hypothetical protein
MAEFEVRLGQQSRLTGGGHWSRSSGSGRGWVEHRVTEWYVEVLRDGERFLAGPATDRDVADAAIEVTRAAFATVEDAA